MFLIDYQTRYRPSLQSAGQRREGRNIMQVILVDAFGDYSFLYTDIHSMRTVYSLEGPFGMNGK